MPGDKTMLHDQINDDRVDCGLPVKPSHTTTMANERRMPGDTNMFHSKQIIDERDDLSTIVHSLTNPDDRDDWGVPLIASKHTVSSESPISKFG